MWWLKKQPQIGLIETSPNIQPERPRSIMIEVDKKLEFEFDLSDGKSYLVVGGVSLPAQDVRIAKKKYTFLIFCWASDDEVALLKRLGCKVQVLW